MKVRNPETNKNFQAEAPGEKDSGEKHGDATLGLSLSWSSDTGRCVDASPVLLVREGAGQRSDKGKTTVFIGSHSHRIQALDLVTGSLLWERVLGDRIEASAAVSRCGSLVVIGQHQLHQYRVKIFDCMSLTFLNFPQVATTAVCISCALRPETRGGYLRLGTL